MIESKLPTSFNFGQRPADAEPQQLEASREAALKKTRVESFSQYEEESNYTPKWLCPNCQRENECAVSDCNQCGDSRPRVLHGDPAQGDPYLGLARLVARGEIKDDRQIKNYPMILKDIATWRSESGYRVADYLFATGRYDQHQYVGWQNFFEYILSGGRV